MEILFVEICIIHFFIYDLIIMKKTKKSEFQLIIWALIGLHYSTQKFIQKVLNSSITANDFDKRIAIVYVYFCVCVCSSILFSLRVPVFLSDFLSFLLECAYLRHTAYVCVQHNTNRVLWQIQHTLIVTVWLT